MDDETPTVVTTGTSIVVVTQGGGTDNGPEAFGLIKDKSGNVYVMFKAEPANSGAGAHAIDCSARDAIDDRRTRLIQLGRRLPPLRQASTSVWFTRAIRRKPSEMRVSVATRRQNSSAARLAESQTEASPGVSPGSSKAGWPR